MYVYNRSKVLTSALLCSLLLLCGCTSIDIAETNLNKLEEVTKKREKILISQYQQQVEAQIGLLRNTYQHRVKEAKANLAYDILKRIRNKEKQLIANSFTDIDNKAAELISNSDHALSAAKAITLSTGNKEAEFVAAAKLAADIGVYTYKRSEAVDKVRAKMAALEDKFISNLSAKFDTSLEQQNILQELDKVEDELKKIQENSDKYLEALDLGFKALERFLDDWDKPLDFLIEGFIGEGVNIPMQELINSKLASLKEKAFSKIDGVKEGIEKEFNKELNKIN